MLVKIWVRTISYLKFLWMVTRTVFWKKLNQSTIHMVITFLHLFIGFLAYHNTLQGRRSRIFPDKSSLFILYSFGNQVKISFSEMARKKCSIFLMFGRLLSKIAQIFMAFSEKLNIIRMAPNLRLYFDFGPIANKRCQISPMSKKFEYHKIASINAR